MTRNDGATRICTRRLWLICEILLRGICFRIMDRCDISKEYQYDIIYTLVFARTEHKLTTMKMRVAAIVYIHSACKTKNKPINEAIILNNTTGTPFKKISGNMSNTAVQANHTPVVPPPPPPPTSMPDPDHKTVPLAVMILVLGSSAGMLFYTKRTGSMLRSIETISETQLSQFIRHNQPAKFGPLTKLQAEKMQPRLDKDDFF